MRKKLVLCLLALGCGHDASVAATTDTTSASFAGGFMPRDEAIDQIATERCLQEEGCHNIGTDGNFPTGAACRAALGATARSRLSAPSCVRGVLESDLANCIKSVRNERCSNAKDAENRAASCSSDGLCR